jgi:hypothetical protein
LSEELSDPPCGIEPSEMYAWLFACRDLTLVYELAHEWQPAQLVEKKPDAQLPQVSGVHCAALMVSETVAVRESPPPEAVTVRVALPAALLVVESVSVDDPLPDTLAGLNFAVTPEGSPETASDTALEKPLAPVTVTALVPDPPAVTVSDAGLTESANDGAAAMVRWSEVEWVALPPLPVSVSV